MKLQFKHLATTAVALAAAAAAHAQTASSVTIYGIADAYAQYAKGATSLARSQSGGLSGSRIGFRGNEDLGGGMHAIFTLESGINIDDGTTGQNAFWGRQAFVGLTSPWGALTLGRQYASIYNLSNDFSEFGNVSAGASTAVIGGFANGYEPIRGANNSGTGNGGPARVNNSVKYETPSFSGFKVGGLAGLGEVSGNTRGSRVGDIYGRYTAGPIDAMVSYVTDKAQALNLDVTTISAAGAYGFGDARVTGGYVSVNDRTVANQDGDGYWVGGDYRFGGVNLVKAQYVVNHKKYDSRGKTQAFGVGYQYDLSKRTALYTSLTYFKNQGNGYTDRWASAVPAGLTDANHRNISEFVGGIRHAF